MLRLQACRAAHLDRYITFELLVGTPEHQPHSAGSDLLEYAVMAQNLPDNWSLRRHYAGILTRGEIVFNVGGSETLLRQQDAQYE